MSFFLVCTRFRHPRLRFSCPNSLMSEEWQGQGEGSGCAGKGTPVQEQGQYPQYCGWQGLWGQGLEQGLPQSTITYCPAFYIGLVNSFSILKACSIRIFSTSFDRQFISYFWPYIYPLLYSCSADSLNFSCFSSALSQRSQRERLTIFSDFSEQLERLLRLMGKCSSWLVSDLRRRERLLGSREEKVWTVETCWLTPRIFFLCSLLVPHSDSSSLFLLSAVSIAQRMLFSMSTPMKYNDLHIFLSSLSRAFNLPFSSYLFHCAWNSSYRALSSPPSTMIFSPAQQQKSQQMLLICLKKLINLDRCMLRHRFSPPSSTIHPQISWMGYSLDSDLSSKLSSLRAEPCEERALRGSLLSLSSLSTRSVVAS